MIGDFKYYDNGIGCKRVSEYLKHAQGDDTALMKYHKKNVFHYMAREWLPDLEKRGEKIKIAKGGPHEVEVISNSDDLSAAQIGTAVHDMAALKVAKYAGLPFEGFTDDVDWVRDEEPKEYLNALESLDAWFSDWVKLSPDVIYLEQSFASARLGVGGTPDLVCRYQTPKGHITLIEDWKTSGSLKYQHCVQIGAYSILIKEKTGLIVDGARLIHLPKSSGSTYNVLDVPRSSSEFCLDEYEEDFMACLRLGKRSKIIIPI